MNNLSAALFLALVFVGAAALGFLIHDDITAYREAVRTCDARGAVTVKVVGQDRMACVHEVVR